MNLEEHLKRQIAFSRATFGPGERTAGVIDHIRKELVEVEELIFACDDYGQEKDGLDRGAEWVDVVILALDGLTRSLLEWQLDNSFEGDLDIEKTAKLACEMILEKQNRNELRTWPDWRKADPNKAIEHDRTKD
jgi:Protein of unknown function (DUF550)